MTKTVIPAAPGHYVVSMIDSDTRYEYRWPVVAWEVTPTSNDAPSVYPVIAGCNKHLWTFLDDGSRNRFANEVVGLLHPDGRVTHTSFKTSYMSDNLEQAIKFWSRSQRRRLSEDGER